MGAVDDVRAGGAARLVTGCGAGSNRAEKIAGEVEDVDDVDGDDEEEEDDGFDSRSPRRRTRNGAWSCVCMTHCDTVWNRIPRPPPPPAAHL